MPKNDLLYSISLRDGSDAKGAAPELLGALFENLSSWKDEESQELRHTLYFTEEPERDAAFDLILRTVPDWAEFGVLLSDAEKHVVRKENWAESWKLHFHTIVISDHLAVRPSWEAFEAKTGQIVLTLDPGMSFGTGQHATTKFCLSALDRFARDGSMPRSVLDAGAGSGILAIAAVKLGFHPVAAFDIDPETVPVARDNARINGIPDEHLPFDVASLLDFPATAPFDVVAANILSSALIAGREKLLRLVKPGGKLILAGILDAEYHNVRTAFEALGCKELFSEPEREWRGGAFSVPG